MNHKTHKRHSDERLSVTTILAIFGSIALFWLLAVKWMPDIVPGFTPAQPSKGVVILDVAGYLQTSQGLSEAEKANVWIGVVNLAEDLASQGYIVIQPSEVIHAPTSAYVPNSLIDEWVSVGVESSSVKTLTSDEEGR